jgi:hypothetical protein
MGCSPCQMALLKAECLPSAGAACTAQSSSSTAADGTFTKVDNLCFSDGTKSLETDTYQPGANIPTKVVQLSRDGALCSTVLASTTTGLDVSGNTVDIFTEIVDDPMGNLLVTVVTTTRRNQGATQTKTVTCPGQPTEALVPACLPGVLVSNCSAGTCM